MNFCAYIIGRGSISFFFFFCFNISLLFLSLKTTPIKTNLNKLSQIKQTYSDHNKFSYNNSLSKINFP